MRDVPTIELLYFPDCPNWRLAAERLTEVAERRGLCVTYRVISSDEEAEERGFRGSPTILLDGVDPFASGGEPFGLSCRLYQTPEGLAGAPTVEQLAVSLNPSSHLPWRRQSTGSAPRI